MPRNWDTCKHAFKNAFFSCPQALTTPSQTGEAQKFVIPMENATLLSPEIRALANIRVKVHAFHVHRPDHTQSSGRSQEIWDTQAKLELFEPRNWDTCKDACKSAFFSCPQAQTTPSEAGEAQKCWIPTGNSTVLSPESRILATMRVFFSCPQALTTPSQLGEAQKFGILTVNSSFLSTEIGILAKMHVKRHAFHVHNP